MICNLPPHLPAVEALLAEHIRVLAEPHCLEEGHIPLRILVLNLMPLKEVTECDLIRLLSASPLSIDLTLMHIKEHQSKNTSQAHLDAYYRTFDELKSERFDGFIVTGAPVDQLPFEEVTYWPQIETIFDWARTNVRSTLYICWAAQAALYHFYGVPKYPLEQKQFGIFRHTLVEPYHPIFRGFDEEFYVPHSRHTEVRREDILANSALTLLSESEEAGVYMVSSSRVGELFITGHSEYSPLALDREYRRDRDKGLPIAPPHHYYRNNDPDQAPVVRWRAHANLLFVNWLNYFVNQ